MKFYLDEDLSPKIAEILRKRRVDAISAHEAGMLQASDREQLDRAATEGRCLITRNRNDFIRLTVQFFNEHRPHAGVLIIPHTIPADDFALIARAIADFCSKQQADSFSPYAVDFLQPL